MPVRTPAAPALRAAAGLWLALVGGLAVDPASAAPWPEERPGARVPVERRLRRDPRPAEVRPAVPRAGIVGGYLPRNNNLPIYNEPPQRGLPW